VQVEVTVTDAHGTEVARAHLRFVYLAMAAADG
jgi:hypothetical protein